jgi:hypothetical protein
LLNTILNAGNQDLRVVKTIKESAADALYWLIENENPTAAKQILKRAIKENCEMEKDIYKVDLEFRCLKTGKESTLPCVMRMRDGYQYDDPREWVVTFNGSILGEPTPNWEKAIANALLSGAARVFAGFTNESDLACHSRLIISSDK